MTKRSGAGGGWLGRVHKAQRGDRARRERVLDGTGVHSACTARVGRTWCIGDALYVLGRPKKRGGVELGQREKRKGARLEGERGNGLSTWGIKAKALN